MILLPPITIEDLVCLAAEGIRTLIYTAQNSTDPNAREGASAAGTALSYVIDWAFGLTEVPAEDALSILRALADASPGPLDKFCQAEAETRFQQIYGLEQNFPLPKEGNVLLPTLLVHEAAFRLAAVGDPALNAAAAAAGLYIEGRCYYCTAAPDQPHNEGCFFPEIREKFTKMT